MMQSGIRRRAARRATGSPLPPLRLAGDIALPHRCRHGHYWRPRAGTCQSAASGRRQAKVLARSVMWRPILPASDAKEGTSSATGPDPSITGASLGTMGPAPAERPSHRRSRSATHRGSIFAPMPSSPSTLSAQLLRRTGFRGLLRSSSPAVSLASSGARRLVVSMSCSRLRCPSYFGTSACLGPDSQSPPERW